MNDIRNLFPGRMRERTFQLKAKRDAGAVWHEPQFVECKQCGRAQHAPCGPKAFSSAPTAAITCPSADTTG